MICAAVDELTPLVGVRRACTLVGRPRASHYRGLRGPVHGPPAPRCSPANKLSADEFDALLGMLRSEEFVDLAPAQV